MDSKITMMSVAMFAIAVMAMGITSLIGIDINERVADKTNLVDLTAATGTFTFTSNVTNGELVNITNGAAVYRFEFNTTANGSAATCRTANCIIVNLSETSGTTAAPNPNVYNNSLKASGNLTARINANTSTAAILTAVNTTNLTTLTADVLGSGSNSITLADNAAGIASSGMAGGTDRDTYFNSSADAVDAVETGFDFQEIMILAIVATVIIGMFLSMLGIVRL